MIIADLPLIGILHVRSRQLPLESAGFTCAVGVAATSNARLDSVVFGFASELLVARAVAWRGRADLCDFASAPEIEGQLIKRRPPVSVACRWLSIVVVEVLSRGIPGYHRNANGRSGGGGQTPKRRRDQEQIGKDERYVLWTWVRFII